VANFRKRLQRYWLAITYRLRGPTDYELVDIEVLVVSLPDGDDDPDGGAILDDDGPEPAPAEDDDPEMLLFEKEPPIAYHVPFPFGGGLWLIYIDGKWRLRGLE